MKLRMKRNLNIMAIAALACFLALVMLTSAQQAAVTFLEPVKVPHGADTITFDKIGPVYFGADTNYEERQTERYIDHKLYGKDAKTNDYRLVIDMDPILCQANVELAAVEEQYRVPSSRLTALADITDKDGKLVDSGFAECTSQPYLDDERQRACVYRIPSFKSLAGEQARGNRFTCTIKFLDDNDNAVAQAASQKPAVVADVNYHVANIVDEEKVNYASPIADYGDFSTQYHYFTDISGVRSQEELDDTRSKEKLGKVVFHGIIAVTMNREVSPVQVILDRGLEACFVHPTHSNRMMEVVGVSIGDEEKHAGDVMVGFSPDIVEQLNECNRQVSTARGETELGGESGHAVFGEHYILLSNTKEFLWVYDSVKNLISRHEPVAFSHEMGHAREFEETAGYAACDEYDYELWKKQDQDFKESGFQGCPNPWPPCCCAEVDGTNCLEVNEACMGTEEIRSRSTGRVVIRSPVCYGMPLDYSEQNKLGPFMGFSVMGKGNAYPLSFPSPLPKVG